MLHRPLAFLCCLLFFASGGQSVFAQSDAHRLAIEVAQLNCRVGLCGPGLAAGPPPGPVTCIGGMSIVSGGNTVITFTASGTLTCSGSFAAKALVVAGGGGAMGGGGGAGGYCTTEGTPTCGLGASVTIPSGAVTVTVGAGGAGGTAPFSTDGSPGGNSVLGSIVTATGGGGGGHSAGPGLAGGSGGGGGIDGSMTRAGGAGSQGSNGGNSFASGGSSAAGGGGGAGAVGGNASSATGGNGGNGVSNSISGSSVAYAGGGGGAPDQTTDTAGTGGTGGGGNGHANAVGSSGATNTGGGGGGTSVNGGLAGGAGGSGIVVISCATTVCAGSGFTASCMASATWLGSVSGQSLTEMMADDAMICGMIADGNGCSTWNGSTGTLSALWILATNSTATGYKNMCPAGTGVPAGANITVAAPTVTFTVDQGATGDAMTGYLDAHYLAGTGNDAQNSNLFGVCITNNRSAGQTWTDMDATNFGESILLPKYTDLNTYLENNGNAFNSTTAPATVNGMWIVNRTSSANFTGYVNGTSLYTSTSTSSTPTTNNFILLAQTYLAPTRFSGDTIAAAVIGGGGTPTKVAQISSRIGTRVQAVSGNASCS